MTPDDQERLHHTARIWFEEGFKATGRRVLRLLFLAGLIYLIWRSRTIVTAMIGAGILATAAGALVTPLCRSRVLGFLKPHSRRAVAALFALLFIVGLIVLLIVAFVKPLQSEWKDLVANWPTYQAQIEKQLADLQDWYENRAPDWLHNLVDKQRDQSGGGSENLTQSVTAFVTGMLGKTVAWVGHIVELILLPVMAFYFLVDGRSLRNELLRFLPQQRQQRVALAVLRESGEIMRAYLVAQLVLAVLAGVIVGVLLALAHIKYALVLALVAGVTRAIPVIGPLLGGIPVGVLTFAQCTQTQNYSLLVIILVSFTVMHLFESKVLTPMFLGHRLHLHAVIIIVALLVGGEFFGLLGMFLAAPVAALARTVLTHYYIHPRRRGFRGTSRLARALANQKE